MLNVAIRFQQGRSQRVASTETFLEATKLVVGEVLHVAGVAERGGVEEEVQRNGLLVGGHSNSTIETADRKIDNVVHVCARVV